MSMYKSFLAVLFPLLIVIVSVVLSMPGTGTGVPGH